MANVITVTFFIQDAKSKSAKLLFRSNLDESFPLAAPEQALAAAIFYYQELARRLDVYLKGRIANISIAVDCALPSGIKVAALPHSDVEEGALFVYPKTTSGAYFRHTVPTFDHSIFGTAQQIGWFDLPSPLQNYLILLLQSEDEPIGEDMGQITDNRGERVSALPIIHKVFKPSKGKA